MNWPLISAYAIIGFGVAIGMHCTLAHQSAWKGHTRVAGLILMFLFWPVPVVSLMVLALAAMADR